MYPINSKSLAAIGDQTKQPVSGNACVKPPEDLGLSRELNILRNHVESLGASMASLRERLGNVLRPSEPSTGPAVAGSGPAPAVCTAAQCVQDVRYMVGVIHDIVDDIGRRLDA